MEEQLSSLLLSNDGRAFAFWGLFVTNTKAAVLFLCIWKSVEFEHDTVAELPLWIELSVLVC